ncbi:hypothetical protein MA16_Dca005884 [Dendrobium catenatum]|uniref:Uncharacterized protein n=1 Tax=Dendrobium catenatum TaxID=906689 RepID=A0A2I0WXG3_9ASPA|nr:hypothetical protein MA16_Dca005884 [Dendrobium catenatum]
MGSIVGCGGVIRDHNGKCLLGFAGPTDNGDEKFTISYAILHGLSLYANLYYMNIMVDVVAGPWPFSLALFYFGICLAAGPWTFSLRLLLMLWMVMAGPFLFGYYYNESQERESKGERERGSCEGEFMIGFTKVAPSKDPSSSSPVIIPSSLGVLERSTSTSDQGSLPASGGRKKSWVLCLLIKEAKGVGFSALLRGKKERHCV